LQAHCRNGAPLAVQAGSTGAQAWVLRPARPDVL